MRIAFCIFKYFPFGGIQRDLMKIVRECRARGHAAKIFTLRWETDEAPGVEVEIIPIEGVSRHVQYEHFAERVRDAVAHDKEGFDLVVGFNKMPGLDVYYAGDSCYAEKAQDQRSAAYRLLPRYRSLHAAERAVFDQTSGTEILTLSSLQIPAYRTYYDTPPGRFHSLPPGIERDRVAAHDEEQRDQFRRELREEFNLASGTTVLLFIGSGFIKKGLDRVLLATANLPPALKANTHLFVIGRDKGDAFERMAMRLGISDQVTFLCEGRDDVPRFLFAADGLVHPAYDETAGMVIIEAMLAGLPVIATRNCGYAEYLGRYGAGVVLESPFRQADLNAQLARLVDGEDRQEWIDAGLAARDNKDLFSLVPRAVDYLERFVGERGPLLAFTLFRYFPFGGLQRDFMRIATACLEAGYRVLVYCMEWQGPKPDGFDVVTIETHGIGNHARYADFADRVARRVRWRRPAAVIGFNKMPGLDLYYAADPCFEHKAQDMRSRVYRMTPRYRTLARLERAVFGRASSTRIMLIAESQRDPFVQHYGTGDDRLHILPPGVSRDRRRGVDWEDQRREVRQEFEVGADEYLLVLIGSGFKTKGLDRALQALANLPVDLQRQCHFLAIGQDNPLIFERFARQLGVADRLRILKGRNDVPAILQGADVMVHPAYMESGGLVLIEGVIAGLPVITTSVCGFAGYVREAEAGIVLEEPFSQQELDRALVTALSDENRRSAWSENGVRFGCETEDIYDMPVKALQYIESQLPEVSVAISS